MFVSIYYTEEVQCVCSTLHFILMLTYTAATSRLLGVKFWVDVSNGTTPALTAGSLGHYALHGIRE